jgi:hypothetical protein
MFVNEDTLRRTRQQLCRTASAHWSYDGTLPGADLRGVLRTATTPHMRRMVTFDLLQQWRRSQGLRAH